jgi:hypothetical protein
LQSVERGLGIDEQGGRDQVDSGESMYLSIGETPIMARVNCLSIVAKRMGDSCTQVGEPGSGNRQTRKSPAHSCHKNSFAGMQKHCIKAQRFCIPIDQVAKPESPFGRRG